MIQLLRVPSSFKGDQYDLARFRLTWNVNMMLAFALSLLIAITGFTQSEYAFIYGTALLANIGALIYMKYFLDYRAVALILSILMYGLILGSFFSVDGYLHYLEPFWAMVIVLYVYFIRGKILGDIALMINITATSIFFITRIDHTVNVLHELTLSRLISMSIEFIVCLSLIGYLIHQFIDANRRAESELRTLNDTLLQEQTLIRQQNNEKTILLQEIHHRVKKTYKL